MTHPPLTPVLGPWLRRIEGKQEHRLGVEMKLLDELLDELPEVDVLSLNLSPGLMNWLPFYWRGFSSSLRYTYRIENTNDPDRVWSEFRENIRREVRKASRTVEVRSTDDVELFIHALRPMAKRAGWSQRTESVVRRVDHACRQRDANLMLLAVDASDRPRACTMLVRDDGFVYYLLAGRNDQEAPTGAASLIVWEGIKYASEKGLAFDFEGSMIKSIERFFRAFGARQVPYLRVTRNSIKGRGFLVLRSLLRRWPV
jgi:lipid II:glycine glycyltransferase (peptidoglycan interpeptide bridge formation enzyme)